MCIDYTMTILNCTLLNFAHVGILHPIFESYSNDFEYTTNGIFRRIVSPDCPKCGYRMNHNGYNEHCKKGLGSVNIGRYLCPICEEPLEESRSFWEQLKTDFFRVMQNIYQRFRIQNVSYQGASAVMVEIDSFEAFVQKRLRMIKKNWKHLTEFYFMEDAPATNNLVENYYSTSLKTHGKATQD